MKIELPSFDNAKILVVGDVMLDRYWHGPTSRISPEAPVPIVKVETIEDRPGGAANVALNIASLGAGAALLGMTGQDEAADTLQSRLKGAKVDCHFSRQANYPTITKLRVISRHQQLIRLDFEEGFFDCGHEDLLNQYQALLSGVNSIILSDYAKGALHEVRTLIRMANERNIPVLVDPKGADFSKYDHATLITPNLSEFEMVVGHCKNEQILVEKGIELLKKHQWKALLITRGEQGMTLLREGMPELHLPAQAKEVYDVTGAGDTVIATLAACMAAGSELPEAVALANLAAGVVVGKLGTAAITAPELRRAMQLDGNHGGGVVSEAQLLNCIEESKAQNERIVFTNGCFDILHAGHVSYLEQAKKLGDRLIVAVNTDDSVRKLKGEGRPVNPVERRMAVLAALEAVDWVVPFSEETPERLICALLPDVLVKGGDYKPEQIAGGKCVIENGGEVRVLGFEHGCSTTAIIENIKQNAKGDKP